MRQVGQSPWAKKKSRYAIALPNLAPKKDEARAAARFPSNGEKSYGGRARGAVAVAGLQQDFVAARRLLRRRIGSRHPLRQIHREANRL